MNLAYWCVLIAGLMPVFTVAVAKWGRRDDDNSEPRGRLDKQAGTRRRTDYAHRNHFDAFPFFAAAVIIAQQAHAQQTTVNTLAALFIALRLMYTFLYLTDRATWCSVAWTLGYFCVIGLFVAAVLG